MSNEESMKFKWGVHDRLSTVSPTLCLAKWLQTTITLYNGMTHSCHHTPRHNIELDTIRDNPRALHNTPIKIYQRQEMLEGVQVEGCDYCWRIENLPEKHLSDRTYKSSRPWALPKFDEVVTSGTGANIMPTYVEVAFENVCNFKCTYCSPLESSRWMEEIEKDGPYQLTGERTVVDLKYYGEHRMIPIHHKSPNPYIEAFWRWWPELVENLHTFRITGGEPLLSDNTWKVIQYLKDNPKPNLELSINSNMGIPAKLVDKLIGDVNDLVGNQKIKKFMLFTSAEATGRACEYIRYGMDWELFTSNVHRFIASTPETVKVGFMTTHNILSYSTWTDFMRWMVALRAEFDRSRTYTRIWVSINYLRHPDFMAATQLPPALKLKVTAEWRAFAEENKKAGLYLEEVDMVHRLCDYIMSQDPDPQLVEDFKLYFAEQDKRRHINLQQTFPELVWDESSRS